MLGVGGVRALRRLGLAPTVFHMNEGHSAFLAIERLRELTASGIPLERALDEVRGSTVFTTHTPVPAGNEVFEPALVQRYLAGVVAGTGLDWDDFLALGRVTDGDLFGLTPLALRLAGRANGVSALHGSVAREMWQPLWPDKRSTRSPSGASRTASTRGRGSPARSARASAATGRACTRSRTKSCGASICR